MSTYLLVHGAWHSGQCWERVVPLLESAGHRVVTPSLAGLRRPGAPARPRGGARHPRRRHRRADHRGGPQRGGTRGTQLCRAGHLVRGQPGPGPDSTVGVPRRDGPGGRRERGRCHAHHPAPDRSRPAVGQRLAGSAAARNAAAHGPVRGHRPGGRRLAAQHAVGPAGALPPAAGPAGQPGRAPDPPDAHPL